MIYIVTALYCEARQLIRAYQLEKNLQETRYQEFYQADADMRLIVTGVGEIAAAVVTGSICAKYQPQAGDFLINLGICAGGAHMQGIYLCHQLKEQATGRTFYPDVLYCHPFQETSIVTGMLPWQGHPSKAVEKLDSDCLYDMEAAAVYQAGAYYFAPHQMSFLKIVSDQGNVSEVSQKQVETLLEAHHGQIVAYISQLREISDRTHVWKKGCRQDVEHAQSYQGQELAGLSREQLLDKLCTDMHCSKSMRDCLGQHIHYRALAGIDYLSQIQAFYTAGMLPCKDKREGKKYFEQFCRKIFE